MTPEITLALNTLAQTNPEQLTNYDGLFLYLSIMFAAVGGRVAGELSSRGDKNVLAYPVIGTLLTATGSIIDSPTGKHLMWTGAAMVLSTTLTHTFFAVRNHTNHESD